MAHKSIKVCFSDILVKFFRTAALVKRSKENSIYLQQILTYGTKIKNEIFLA